MANNVSQFPSILQAKADQSSQHTDEIRKYYLGNVLLVRSHRLKGTEQYSFISVTLSTCTEENLGGNDKCLHISIICYIVCIAPPSWHKVKVGLVQELKKGGKTLPVAVVGGQTQQQRGFGSLMSISTLWGLRFPHKSTLHTWHSPQQVPAPSQTCSRASQRAHLA